jgi:hypothetical protein
MNDLNDPVKSMPLFDQIKSNIQLYVFYRRHTLDYKTQIGQKKKISHVNKDQKSSCGSYKMIK